MRVHPIFTNKFFFGLAIVILLVFVVLDARQYQQHKQVADEIQSLKNQSNQLQQQNNDLQNLVTNWQSNAAENTDKAAREQLNLQKPGEKVYSFTIPATNSSTVATGSSSGASQDLVGISNAHKWWNYFFNNN